MKKSQYKKVVKAKKVKKRLNPESRSMPEILTKVSRAKNLGKSSTFFTADARRAFTKLRQAFIKPPILNHFDPEHHIRIETDVLGYAISKILS